MNILLLSTADWDHPFWTNKQHVALALAKEGHRVVYVDSLGLRKPKMAGKDKKRVIKRIKRIFSSPRKITSRLWVVSPLVIPGIQKGIFAWLNRLILFIFLRYSYIKLGFKCNILWTYSPATVQILNPRHFQSSLYHCVDDISAQPLMPKMELEKLEILTAQKVSHIVVTSPALFRKLKGKCNSLHLMPNVVEYDHFSNPTYESVRKAKESMQSITSPIIGFVGAISSYKINFDLLKYLADSQPKNSFVLIGSIGEGEEGTDVSELKRRKNIFFLGPKSYQEVPGFISNFDVAILPNRINQYTQAMFPMKFFEYLASGVPIVAMEIPSLIPYKEYLSLCDSFESFSNEILKKKYHLILNLSEMQD